MKLVVVDAGLSSPSSTRNLADLIARRTHELLIKSGESCELSFLELSDISLDVVRSLISGIPKPVISEAISTMATADGLIFASPVYKAGISGLLKSFLDLLDDDLLIGKPVAMVATAGTARHALVLDDQFRALLAFFRTLTIPSSVFAATSDWNTPDLDSRITRAALELSEVMKSRVGSNIAELTWSKHQHHFAGNASHAEQTMADVDFSTDLMRLAIGKTIANSTE